MTEAIATTATVTPIAAARKEAPGIIKRSSAYFIDPATVTRKAGFNPRFDFGDIESLATSIKANGMLNPIRVKRLATPQGTTDGHLMLFELVDGDRRLTAVEKLLKAGHEFPEGIPAILVDKNQQDVTSIIQMFLANDSKLFNPMEEALAYKKMREAGMTVKQICDAVGRKQVHVTEILALLEADESLQAAAKAGTIGKTMAKQIATHARGDKAKQVELVTAAAKAGKNKDAQRAVKKAIDESRRSKAARKGQVLKMRSLSDAELSAIGAKLAEGLAQRLKEAGKPADFDIASWVKLDDNLSLAATFGALEALKAAAGLEINLEY